MESTLKRPAAKKGPKKGPKKKTKKFFLPKGKDAATQALDENPTQADKLFSHVHVRKCHDAILLGAE